MIVNTDPLPGIRADLQRRPEFLRDFRDNLEPQTEAGLVMRPSALERLKRPLQLRLLDPVPLVGHRNGPPRVRAYRAALRADADYVP